VQNEGQTVTLQTKVVTSSITNTVGDSEPLAVYAVSKFLQPMELFKVVEAPAPAPEPSKKKANAADDSGDGTSDDGSGDDTADAAPSVLARWVTAAAMVAAAFALMG
jgi:hypothetical protein